MKFIFEKFFVIISDTHDEMRKEMETNSTKEMPRNYKKIRNEKGWIRVSMAARILGRTSAGVLKMIEDGRLVAEQPAGPNSIWFIDPASIDKIINDNRA